MIKVINIREVGKYAGKGRIVNIMRTGDQDGLLGNPYFLRSEADRDEVIEKFRHYLWGEIKKGGKIKQFLASLVHEENLFLMCCCSPKPCHGDVIKHCIEWMQRK